MPKKSQNSQFLTKRDIQDLASKKDLKVLEDKLGEKLDNIANTLDGFVGTVDNLRVENEVGANQIRDLRERADDHETRITKLESPSA